MTDDREVIIWWKTKLYTTTYLWKQLVATAVRIKQQSPSPTSSSITTCSNNFKQITAVIISVTMNSSFLIYDMSGEIAIYNSITV